MTNTDYSISSLQKYLPMLRKLYGWTMEQLGDRIGVTKQTISNLEHDNPKMTKVHCWPGFRKCRKWYSDYY